MKYAIVDIETTGSFAGSNSITEIAIILHDGNKALKKFQSLINPTIDIPYHIQTLTGISNEMVRNAPTFDIIAPSIIELLDKNIFVAHNVNFDYSFLVKELKAVGYNLKTPKLCTVRLARKIIPNQASYSLGKLCQVLDIPNNARHRAMGDAEATTILFEKLVRNDFEGIIAKTLKKTKEQKLPTHIAEEDYNLLPEKPGVYIFKDKSQKIIYVGKAINIKKRVLNHFIGNNESLKRQQFINEVRSIDFLESATELMALLMECNLIQQHWPKHNKALKKFEPKYGLMYYENQQGYIRLMISPYDRHANIIQHFERANDGNKLLLDLIEQFELDIKLCTFFSNQETYKSKVNYDNCLPADKYNNRIYNAIDYVNRKKKSFIILDQGRNLNEKSYIYLKEGSIFALGFISFYSQINDIDDIIQEKDKVKSNYYMTSLVLQYAERFPSKVIKMNFLNKT